MKIFTKNFIQIHTHLLLPQDDTKMTIYNQIPHIYRVSYIDIRPFLLCPRLTNFNIFCLFQH